MAGNVSLKNAAKTKNDEFYTQLSDIEKELRHYKKAFKDKTIFCNCDDPFESNFFKYFVLNFNRLGLKKLICTCYSGSPIANTQLSLFDVDEASEENKPYKAIVTTVYDKTGDGGIDMFDISELFKSGENELTELKGDGDFRSEECIELLKEADIVVTNPPFSLFREYVTQLFEYDKKFIIIGSKNAIAYKEVFPLIRDNKIWVGYGFSRGDAYFEIPKDKIRDYAIGVYNAENGLVHFRNCTWYTNIDIKKRHEEIILVKRYNKEQYPTYCNFNGINIDKIVDIPCDYAGAMGVPVTFLDNYNPNQFVIIGLGSGYLGQSIGITGIPKEHKALMKGHSAAGDLYYLKDGVPKVPYSRVLIRNKHPEEPKK